MNQNTGGEASGFYCLDLNGAPDIKSLEKVLQENQSGFHAFYTHASWINGVATLAEGSPRTITQCFKSATKVFVNDCLDKMSSSNGEQPTDPLMKDTAGLASPLVLIGEFGTKTSPGVVQQFFQALREHLNNGYFQRSTGYSLNQAAVWDLFLERERYSGIIPGAQGYHEYLLWDGGGLLKRDRWDEISSAHNPDLDNRKALNRAAWIGAGWLSSGLKKIANPKQELLYPQEVEIWARQANESLLRSQSALAAHYASGSGIFRREPWNNYVRTLCEFLPYHQRTDKRTDKRQWLPSNGLAEPGGPMPWRGLLDDWLHMHKRHLLLDGWLTLWPCEDPEGNPALYLQPGSLALLYWAAKRADMPHTESPKSFIDNYAWGDDPHWFGGCWNRLRHLKTSKQ